MSQLGQSLPMSKTRGFPKWRALLDAVASNWRHDPELGKVAADQAVAIGGKLYRLTAGL
jgi:hypothetical protein